MTFKDPITEQQFIARRTDRDRGKLNENNILQGIPLIICYHGTSKRNVESIIKNGFNDGTHFTLDLQIALEVGGNYVFRVEFPREYILSKVKLNEPPNKWTFPLDKPLPEHRIMGLRRYNFQVLDPKKPIEEQERALEEKSILQGGIKQISLPTIIVSEKQKEIYTEIRKWAYDHSADLSQWTMEEESDDWINLSTFLDYLNSKIEPKQEDETEGSDNA